MNTNPDPKREDALLDAVLRDQSWQSTNAAFKAEALGAFRTRQRAWRLTRWAGCAVALAGAVACLMHWPGRPVAVTRQMAAKPPDAPRASAKPRYLTDEELVASFPEGTCFLAEIDGKKALVFLDPNVERQYVSNAGLGAP
jgi:hypothetical protein